MEATARRTSEGGRYFRLEICSADSCARLLGTVIHSFHGWNEWDRRTLNIDDAGLRDLITHFVARRQPACHTAKQFVPASQASR